MPRLRRLQEPPLPGDVVWISRLASVQFVAVPPFWFAVRRVEPPLPYADMCWIHGYVLDITGEAAERRSLYIRPHGLLISAEPAAQALRPLTRTHRQAQQPRTAVTNDAAD